MDTSAEFFVRCASGFEKLLVEELKSLKIKRLRPLKGGVVFFGSVQDAYRVCLWSRVASRVLLLLARVEAADAESLYRGVKEIEWEHHLGTEATLSVYAHGVNEALRNTQFTAVKVKDAICDRLRDLRGVRPNVLQKKPSVLVDVSIRSKRASISLDLSGEPLHRRGYRKEGQQGIAPLKENLAAALVLDSGWTSSSAHHLSFLDPMCGSGTLVIEAGLIAADAAPGILRDYWGFSGWSGHDEKSWRALLDEADERFACGLKIMPLLVGTDNDASSISLCRENSKRAGLGEHLIFEEKEASSASVLVEHKKEGMMVVNPPYGERLGSPAQLKEVYAALSKTIETLPDTWSASIITPDSSIDAALGMIPERISPFYNGRIETTLRHYSLNREKRNSVEVVHGQKNKSTTIAILEKNSEQFASRLKKVAKTRTKWAKQKGITAYRIYDADLPDYAVSLDLVEDDTSEQQEKYLIITEYRAPKTIEPERAQRRLLDVVSLAPKILNIADGHVFLKERRRDKGGGQYRDHAQEPFVVHTHESGYIFELDLSSHLDTGLFLDHRLTRQLVAKEAKGRHFLNLFAYTGSASVYAAGGGALSTTTVDLSHTYLSWAKRNMQLNGFAEKKHSFVRADVLSWLEGQEAEKRHYDLVFVDPPTFSNSKSMGEKSWSVDRDHVRLLKSVHQVLSPGGVCFFSCNLRGFKPDLATLGEEGIDLVDITAETIPEDFSRNPKIHRCFRFEKE